MCIINCQFTLSNSELNGGCLYLSIIDKTPTKKVDVNQCIFNSPGSKQNKSNIKANDLFLFTNCDFTSGSVFIDSYSAEFDSCRFNDISNGPNAIRYINTATDTDLGCKISVNKCNFTQKTNIESLIYFTTKLHSSFHFTDNNISIQATGTHVIGYEGGIENIKGDENKVCPII